MGFFDIFLKKGTAVLETMGSRDVRALAIRRKLLGSSNMRSVEVVFHKASKIKGHHFKYRYLSDGLKVVGFASFPKNFDPNRKYSLMIFNHGGMGDDGKLNPVDFAHFTTQFIEEGYIVFASQYRGIGGSEGREEYGGREVRDILNLLALAQTYEFIDEDNSFMLGHSRGGAATYLAIKQGARINAAATFGAPTDLFKLNIEKYKHLIVGFDGDKEEAYRMRSAVYWPDRIRTPLLILHGSGDKVVSEQHARDLANKLNAARKIYELKIFPGGDHNLSNFRAERNEAILRWFKRFSSRLTGGAPFVPYSDAGLNRQPYDYATGLRTKYDDPSLLYTVPYDVSSGAKAPYDHGTGVKQPYDMITGKIPKAYDPVTGLKYPYDVSTGSRAGYDPVTGNNKPRRTRRQRLYGWLFDKK